MSAPERLGAPPNVIESGSRTGRRENGRRGAMEALARQRPRS